MKYTNIGKEIKQIKPNVFVDNNYSNIESILKDYSEMQIDEIYLTNPLIENRTFNKSDNSLNLNFTIDQFDIMLINDKYKSEEMWFP